MRSVATFAVAARRRYVCLALELTLECQQFLLVLCCQFLLHVKVLLGYSLLFDIAVFRLLVSTGSYPLFQCKHFIGLFRLQLIYCCLDLIGTSTQPIFILLLIHSCYLGLDLMSFHIVLLFGHMLFHLL